ncbi:MAG: hypothetical protein A2284_09125 [Deltaproteobacteria bacterium RIFOXYA12_FULL_61_11]|nr:MAG: hypothetical protein A2284_09125 [Deltaproteobacteria bacterium RIFOXYA12_FULL_61_11]
MYLFRVFIFFLVEVVAQYVAIPTTVRRELGGKVWWDWWSIHKKIVFTRDLIAATVRRDELFVFTVASSFSAPSVSINTDHPNCRDSSMVNRKFITKTEEILFLFQVITSI